MYWATLQLCLLLSHAVAAVGCAGAILVRYQADGTKVATCCCKSWYARNTTRQSLGLPCRSSGCSGLPLSGMCHEAVVALCREGTGNGEAHRTMSVWREQRDSVEVVAAFCAKHGTTGTRRGNAPEYIPISSLGSILA